MSGVTGRRREPRRLLGANESLMPTGAIMTREQAEEIVQKVVKFSKADEVDGESQQCVSE